MFFKVVFCEDGAEILESLVIHDPALNRVILDDLIRPLPELNRPLVVDLESDGDDRLQVIVVGIIFFPVIGSY